MLAPAGIFYFHFVMMRGTLGGVIYTAVAIVNIRKIVKHTKNTIE